MADDNFRSYRGRGAGAPAGAPIDDPLAELARLIGQSDPARDTGRDMGRDARHGAVPSFNEPSDEPSLDWAAQDGDVASYDDADRYVGQAGAEPDETAYDDRYEAPDDQLAEPPSGRHGSALSTRLNGARDFARDYYAPPEESRFQEMRETRAMANRQAPAFPPEARVDRYQFDDAADDQADAVDEYQEEELPAGRRRGGFFVVAAVLGLAIVGTAGAFAYRAMFGSSMLPTLPPIIKAEDGPNKIVPAKPKTNSDQADARNAGSGEKLVSREEQPVDMPAPVNPAPRVISTVPIFPDPNSGQAGVPNSVQSGLGADATAGAPAPNRSLTPAPMPPPMAASTPPAQANSIWPPAPASAAPAAAAPAPAAPAAVSTAPRKIHTVVIHSDQLASQIGSQAGSQIGSQVGSQVESLTAEASAMPPRAPTAAAAPAPVRTAPMRQAAPPPARAMPAARIDANAPLSIVPNQAEEAPPAPAPRTRTALARPAEAPAAPRAEPAGAGGGGYAVQVTSQRSEAEAQAEFRALKAKFPKELGGREPLIRRADLGAKGVYYRALVGPFASAEQATALCSGLKSAGGSCIVQRN